MILSRRQVLQSATALAMTGPAPRPSSFDFAYFSDTHVSLDRNIEENRRMMREIRRAFRPAFAVNGGDVTDYGWRREYENYQRLEDGFPSPIYCNPGNHDVRWSPLGLNLFESELGAPYRSFEHEGVLFVLLDSTVPLSHWGSYSVAQLDWLEKVLARWGSEKPVLIFTHHWVGREPVMVDRQYELADIIAGHQVAAIFTGHGHSDLYWRWNGIPCVMNRGLYQGSWMQVSVDRETNFLRVSRTALGVSKLIFEVPLWRPSLLPVETPREMKLNTGGWTPMVGPVLEPGVNRIIVREREGWAERSALKFGPIGLKTAWSTKLDGGVMSHITADGGQVLVSTMSGSVGSFDAVTGRQNWRTQIGGYCHSSPVVTGEAVLIGSSDGKLRRLDRSTGKVVWSAVTEGPIYASAAVESGVAGIASGDGNIYGFDLATGARKWIFEMPKSDVAFCQSPACSGGGMIYFGAWDSHLYALDATTGELKWRAGCCADRSFHYAAAIGGPTYADGRIIIPANGNVLYCFDAKTGREIWKRSAPGDKFGYSTPRIQGGKIYVGCLGDLGQVRCAAASNGEILWTAALGETIYDSSPTLEGDWLAIPTCNGRLGVIEAATGKVKLTERLEPGLCLASPGSSHGLVFTATFNAVLRAYRLPEA